MAAAVVPRSVRIHLASSKQNHCLHQITGKNANAKHSSYRIAGAGGHISLGVFELGVWEGERGVMRAHSVSKPKPQTRYTGYVMIFHSKLPGTRMN